MMSFRNYVRMARRELRDLFPPEAARVAAREDLTAGLGDDPGVDCAVTEAVRWLCRAQDYSTTHDGGVARHFSLITGWGSSYPETTGYIVPTLLAVAEENGDANLADRARRMLDWLVAIQFPDGSFQGGCVDSLPVVPVTFNTGQILLGLASGAARFGEPYATAMLRTAQWLVETLDEDGCWRLYPTPFALAGEKVYETHVSWGLFEASRVSGNMKFASAGVRNVQWALTKQQMNGWFESCCLDAPTQPLTHTLGYTLRGLLEAYRFTGLPELLVAARRTAEGLLGAIRPDGYLAGRLDRNWRPTVTWNCLTGLVQVASCLLILFQMTGDLRYRDAAFAANRFVRRTVKVDGPDDIRGGVKGTFPVSGDYCRFEYVNWAAKFFIDSNRLERKIRTALQ
jgi:hypothetical protein